jgi:hypothetical protein
LIYGHRNNVIGSYPGAYISVFVCQMPEPELRAWQARTRVVIFNTAKVAIAHMVKCLTSRPKGVIHDYIKLQLEADADLYDAEEAAAAEAAAAAAAAAGQPAAGQP